MNNYIIYTDGSYKSSTDTGGWAAIICDASDNIEKELYGGFSHTSSPRMEIYGVLEGLNFIKDPSEITIISDSQYVVNTINQGWLESIINNPAEYSHVDLWNKIAELLNKHNVKIIWTKGHANNEMNNRADKLAQFVARTLNLPKDEYFDNSEESRKSLVPEFETRWSNGFNTRQENGKIVYSLG